jgi:Glycosyltransferase
MRIAILSPFYPYRGGIAQFSAMMYLELQKEGHDVKAFNFTRLYPGFLFPGKTQYVKEGDNSIPVENTRCLSSINPISYFKTVKEIKAFAPDVLIISYWMSFFVPGYAHIAKRMKKHCKVIALTHNAIPHEPKFLDKPLASLMFKHCHGFIALSENVVEELKLLTKDPQYVLTPHPLYDRFGESMEKSTARKKLGIDKDKKAVLFFGLIRDYKGLDLLIDAMEYLDDDYQLIIAGECYGSFEKYQEQIDISKAKDYIFVHNRYISDEEIPAFFSSADALILPYRSATQSGVAALACHYNLPMVSTPVGDFKDSIDIANTGVVTDFISAPDIAKGIRTLLEDGQAEACKANIGKLKKDLSWATFIEKINPLLKK